MSSHHESTPSELLREELLSLLRDSLSIRIDVREFCDDRTIKVRLLLDGEEISSDQFSVRD